MTPPRPLEMATNADLRGSWQALLRAAVRAREIAAQTGTALVVVRDGGVAHIYPQPASTVSSVKERTPPYGERP